MSKDGVQISHDSPPNSRLKTRGFLNTSTSKEEFMKGEERYIQGIAKVVQVRQNSQPFKSKREVVNPEDESQFRNTYFRQTRDLGKSSTDRESLMITSKGAKIDEVVVKETKDFLRDFSHKALKPPVLSDIRENMSMQGFNIFKVNQPAKETKETKNNKVKEKTKEPKEVKEAKEANVNLLISAPTTTRGEEEEAKQGKNGHTRSKSSLYKTKIIMKGPSLCKLIQPMNYN